MCNLKNDIKVAIDSLRSRIAERMLSGEPIQDLVIQIRKLEKIENTEVEDNRPICEVIDLLAYKQKKFNQKKGA